MYTSCCTQLDDVEAGGATVFTQAGVTVWPKKGMAVFWWNLLSDLNGDMTTRHGGCPVLHGSKWSNFLEKKTKKSDKLLIHNLFESFSFSFIYFSLQQVVSQQ